MFTFSFIYLDYSFTCSFTMNCSTFLLPSLLFKAIFNSNTYQTIYTAIICFSKLYFILCLLPFQAIFVVSKTGFTFFHSFLVFLILFTSVSLSFLEEYIFGPLLRNLFIILPPNSSLTIPITFFLLVKYFIQLYNLPYQIFDLDFLK